MSKHNRERKFLWKLGIHPKQTGRKATPKIIAAAKERSKGK